MSAVSTSFREESAPLLIGTGRAVFSADDVYRYTLTRTWGDPGRRAVWIMLNPSTATAFSDDPTIRRCIRFTRGWGLGSLTVVNLFALRATDPAALAGRPDPAGPGNDQMIREAVQGARLTVAAWGAHPMAAGRASAVAALMPAGAPPLQCLGVTKDGWPRHPLYVRASERLRPWRPPGSAPVAEFVAPAAQVLADLHRPDPAVPPGLSGDGHADGATICGQSMLTADSWLPVAKREGDRVCRGCEGEDPEAAEGVLF